MRYTLAILLVIILTTPAFAKDSKKDEKSKVYGKNKIELGMWDGAKDKKEKKIKDKTKTDLKDKLDEYSLDSAWVDGVSTDLSPVELADLLRQQLGASTEVK